MLSDLLDKKMELKEMTLSLVHYFGTISSDHLAQLLGIKKNSVTRYISEWNKEGDFIRKKYPPRRGKHRKRLFLSGQTYGPRMLYLGKDGRKVIEKLLDTTIREYEPSSSQLEHTWGTNEILLSIYSQCTTEEDFLALEWWNTSEARDYLLHQYKKQKKQSIREQDIIEPDARLQFGSYSCWIEFDNSTERIHQIERKYRRYLFTLIPIKNKEPILWFTRNVSRAIELKEWWEDLQHSDLITSFQQSETFYLPDMKFIPFEHLPRFAQALKKKAFVS